MLLHDYTLRMVLAECNPSSEKVNALVELSEDISGVLPYLNTVLKGFQYSYGEKILTVKRKGHLITFRPRQIAITKLEDEKEAREVVEELKQVVNETDGNKDHIKPTYTSKSVPRPTEIFKLLPGKNCKECGVPTCFAFAFKLTSHELEWKQCPLLLTEEFEVSRLKLSELFSEGGD
ncbi:MAG: (Fe-S)-binding protein [Deltaproteobacteria bacterium]|nr:(Fe-S)-binding protein [Deltaproteobacteria bacterium]